MQIEKIGFEEKGSTKTTQQRTHETWLKVKDLFKG